MSIKAVERNQNVDIIRGIAILLVVWGHTITGTTINYEKTFLMDLIWALQMPLFMLISGYVTRYSREITSLKELGVYLKKRSISYLLPLVAWTFLIRGVIFGQTAFFNIRKLVYNMDNGYWFFFSLWTIVVIFGVSQFFANTIKKFNTTFGKAVKLFGFYILGAAGLVVIGFFMGINFLCIKLTLYYMPFFFLGYLYGTFQDDIKRIKYNTVITETVIMISLGIFIFLLKKFNIYSMGEGFLEIAIRILASTTGCIAICGICSHTKDLFAKWGGYYSAYWLPHLGDIFSTFFSAFSIQAKLSSNERKRYIKCCF